MERDTITFEVQFKDIESETQRLTLCEDRKQTLKSIAIKISEISGHPYTHYYLSVGNESYHQEIKLMDTRLGERNSVLKLTERDLQTDSGRRNNWGRRGYDPKSIFGKKTYLNLYVEKNMKAICRGCRKTYHVSVKRCRNRKCRRKGDMRLTKLISGRGSYYFKNSIHPEVHQSISEFKQFHKPKF